MKRRQTEEAVGEPPPLDHECAAVGDDLIEAEIVELVGLGEAPAIDMGESGSRLVLVAKGKGRAGHLVGAAESSHQAPYEGRLAGAEVTDEKNDVAGKE